MAEHEKAPDAMEDLKYFALFLFALGFIWLAGGGYTRYKLQHPTLSPTPIPTATPDARVIEVQANDSNPTPVATPGSDVYIIR